MLKDLLESFATSGQVEWIGLRPARKAPMQMVGTGGEIAVESIVEPLSRR